MAGWRVLVVEDDSIVQLDLQHELERLGFVVAAVASSGEEAIAKAARIKVDIVLMDVRLQGAMDGIEAARRIRSAQNIPVIYLTAQTEAETLQAGIPPHYRIGKPFHARGLHAALLGALDERVR